MMKRKMTTKVAPLGPFDLKPGDKVTVAGNFFGLPQTAQSIGIFRRFDEENPTENSYAVIDVPVLVPVSKILGKLND
jgi:hypothetical protein